VIVIQDLLTLLNGSGFIISRVLELIKPSATGQRGPKSNECWKNSNTNNGCKQPLTLIKSVHRNLHSRQNWLTKHLNSATSIKWRKEFKAPLLLML